MPYDNAQVSGEARSPDDSGECHLEGRTILLHVEMQGEALASGGTTMRHRTTEIGRQGEDKSEVVRAPKRLDSDIWVY